ncbi:MAG: hypothetical protein ABJE66_27830 [Deltaproteobacteria bacterium]
MALAGLVCAACTPAPTDDAPASKSEQASPVAPAVVPERIPTGVPHGGIINRVAVSEQGDAAVSLDNVGGLRLWPALDGSREPVPFSVNGADLLAISHVGDELLVGVLDQAGAVQLFRFSRTGVLHGHIQVSGDTEIDQLVAIEGGILVARADESIERYDAKGQLRGRIGAEPGESFGALATRHGAAGVILTEQHLEEQPPVLESEEISDRPKPRRKVLVNRGHAARMRWIVLGDGLRWGAALPLPDKLDETGLAISPDHHRIALFSQMNQLVVLDVTKQPVPVDGPTLTGNPGAALGFVDNDRVVRVSGQTKWWVATHAENSQNIVDPWHVDTGLGEQSINGDGQVADGVVVAGIGSDLLLQDRNATRYLGWRELATGAVMAAGSHVGVETTMSHIVWLDRALQRESDVDLADFGFTARDRVWWLDPNHAAVMSSGDKAALELIDFRHRDQRLALGTYKYIQRVDFDQTTHHLAVVDDGVVRRFALDLEHDQMTELAALDLPFQSSVLIQLDPARNAGAIAIAWGYDDDGERMATYRDGDAKPNKRLKAKNHKVPASSYRGAAADGTIYMQDGEGVFAMRDGKTVRRFPKGEVADSLVADSTGERLVGIHQAAVTMYDPKGTVLWKQNVWGAQGIVFTTDNAGVIVRTSGGLIELDPATGARINAACGFAFGVMTKTPIMNTFNTQPVCEDLGT